MNNINAEPITKGLKSIYLHNSYIRNKRVKLRCDGHTNLIGGNYRGKTTMLNLLPIFAGISPESMVQKAGNKSSFLDFYLPNLQSMIVYEFLGQQGMCLIANRNINMLLSSTKGGVIWCCPIQAKKLNQTLNKASDHT